MARDPDITSSPIRYSFLLEAGGPPPMPSTSLQDVLVCACCVAAWAPWGAGRGCARVCKGVQGRVRVCTGRVVMLAFHRPCAAPGPRCQGSKAPAALRLTASAPLYYFSVWCLVLKLFSYQFMGISDRSTYLGWCLFLPLNKKKKKPSVYASLAQNFFPRRNSPLLRLFCLFFINEAQFFFFFFSVELCTSFLFCQSST